MISNNIKKDYDEKKICKNSSFENEIRLRFKKLND